MILVDTSAICALASADDGFHGDAEDRAARLASSREPLLLHTYVLCEAFALLQRRLGLSMALRVDSALREHETVTVDRSLHDRAVARLRAGGKSRTSLVDAVSFEVMRERGIECAFAFDTDFEAAGFRLFR